MMCPLKKYAGPPQESELILTNYDGRMIRLPRTQVGEEKSELGKVKPMWSTDWSSVTDCPRCGGRAQKHGGMEGGRLTVYRIATDGTWVSMVAACSCFFGAWWTVKRVDPDGRTRIRPIPWADSLRDIPPGLSNTDWRWLYISREPGDGYLQTAYRLPEADTAGEIADQYLASIGIKARPMSEALRRRQESEKVRIVGAIERWEASSPPRWDPEAGYNRKPEDPQPLEERPARRDFEPLTEDELPF